MNGGAKTTAADKVCPLCFGTRLSIQGQGWPVPYATHPPSPCAECTSERAEKYGIVYAAPPDIKKAVAAYALDQARSSWRRAPDGDKAREAVATALRVVGWWNSEHVPDERIELTELLHAVEGIHA